LNPGERTRLGSDPSASRARLAVFIVDSDAKVREHLVASVRAAGWQPMAFGSAEELLADPRSLVPGCILLDVELPGLSGLELQQLLAERAGISLIFASACPDVQLTVRAMKAGAVNFLTKPVDREALVSAITEALERSCASLSRDAEQRVLRGRFAALSAREREVMKLVIGGRLNKQIADELGIAEITVKVHRGRVMRKLRATSLAELVRLGVKLGVGDAEGRRNARAEVGEGGLSSPAEGARAARDAALRGDRRANPATTVLAA
jgi:FixJ family two-component response regulator